MSNLDNRTDFVNMLMEYTDDAFKRSEKDRISSILDRQAYLYPQPWHDAFTQNRNKICVDLALSWQQRKWAETRNMRRMYFQDAWEKRMIKENKKRWLSTLKRRANSFVYNTGFL